MGIATVGSCISPLSTNWTCASVTEWVRMPIHTRSIGIHTEEVKWSRWYLYSLILVIVVAGELLRLCYLLRTATNLLTMKW